MNRIEGRLVELGYTLPEPKHAVGNYLGSKPSGDLLFASRSRPETASLDYS